MIAAALSTLIALRDAPIGFDERQLGLEQLADRAAGKPVAFLGVDRFAGYYLRKTLARAPAGYVPQEIAARPEKTWQQGLAADFDSLDSGQLDKFDYAITTTRRLQLHARRPTSSRSRAPATTSSGSAAATRRAAACSPTRAATPARSSTARHGDARAPGRGAGPRRAGGRELHGLGPAAAPGRPGRRPGARLGGAGDGHDPDSTCTEDGDYRLSLQYHSQVPLDRALRR